MPSGPADLTEYRAYAAEFTLERAEEITGVPAAKIHDAAVLYATSKPATMMGGGMPVVHQDQRGPVRTRGHPALAGLTGNFDVPGGNISKPFSWLEVAGAGFQTREHEFEVPRPWSAAPPRLGAERFPVWTEMINQAQGMDLPRQINSGEPYPLRAMVAFGMNYRMWPDSLGLHRNAVKKLEFIVDVDLFLTDTAKYADIVLPTCSSVERSELRCYPQKYVVFTTPVIEPLGESRSDTDIIFALAEKLGIDYQVQAAAGQGPTAGVPGAYLPNGAPDFQAATLEAAFDWNLEPSGMRIAELETHPAGMPVPGSDPRPPTGDTRNPASARPSGKMEFSSSILEKYS